MSGLLLVSWNSRGPSSTIRWEQGDNPEKTRSDRSRRKLEQVSWALDLPSHSGFKPILFVK